MRSNNIPHIFSSSRQLKNTTSHFSKGECSEDSKTKDAKQRSSLRGSSLKGVPFRRGSLSNVQEDADAEIDPQAICVDEGMYSDLGRRRAFASSKGARRRRSSLDSTRGLRHRRTSHDSADASISVSSVQSKGSSTYQGDSINVMDFGVDHRRRATVLHDAPFQASARGSMSELVDSSGFMAWDNASDSSSMRSDRQPSGQKKELHRRSSSCDTACSFSNLVDSAGFLDWESHDDSSCQGGATVDSKDCKKAPAAQIGKREDVSINLNKSWRIEDYENPSDMMPRQSSPKNIFSKVLGHKLAHKMNATKPDRSVSAEAIQTIDIKRCLLAGRPGDARSPGGARKSADYAGRRRPRKTGDNSLRASGLKSLFRLSSSMSSADESLRHSASVFGHPSGDRLASSNVGLGLGPLFGGSRTGLDSAAAERERPINRKEQLRRELQAAGSHEANARKKFSMSFF